MCDGKLALDWDSDTNIQKVQNRVQGLLKGCKCTKGCKTNACGCKRRGDICSEGCQCNGCANLSHKGMHSGEGEHSESSARREEDQTESASDEEDGGSSVEDDSAGEDALDAEVNAIMRNVFGDEHINDSSECTEHPYMYSTLIPYMYSTLTPTKP